MNFQFSKRMRKTQIPRMPEGEAKATKELPLSGLSKDRQNGETYHTKENH